MKDNDFTEVYNAQVNVFDQALSMVKKNHIKQFDQASIDTDITTAHLLIEAVEMQIDEDKKGSAGLVWVNVNYQAHCILSRSISNVAIECLNYSALVLKTVKNNKWGLKNVGMPEQLNAFPGRYSSGPKGFDSWIVSWWQTIAIGDNWSIDTFVPDDVLISESPEIGKAHAEEYEVLEDGFTRITEN